MVRVKYCVFTFPLVVTAVQTHGGVQSALRRIHAPTRNEAGSYIRASVASDVATLSTTNTLSHQGMTMNIFLLGGWVARPSAFYFCACAGSLSSVFAWSLCSLWSPCLSRVSQLVARVLLSLSLSPNLFSVFLVNCVQPNRTLSALPVPNMPSFSTLLSSYLTLNENTPCIFMHFLLTLLHSYAMFN